MLKMVFETSKGWWMSNI